MMTNDTLHTACCLWEAALTAMDEAEKQEVLPGFETTGHRMLKDRYNYGTAELRLAVASLAPRCDAAWDALPEDDRDNVVFDWEFVPNWLGRNYQNPSWVERNEPEHPTAGDLANKFEREATYWQEEAERLAETLQCVDGLLDDRAITAAKELIRLNLARHTVNLIDGTGPAELGKG